MRQIPVPSSLCGVAIQAQLPPDSQESSPHPRSFNSIPRSPLLNPSQCAWPGHPPYSTARSVQTCLHCSSVVSIFLSFRGSKQRLEMHAVAGPSVCACVRAFTNHLEDEVSSREFRHSFARGWAHAKFRLVSPRRPASVGVPSLSARSTKPVNAILPCVPFVK